LLSLPLKPEFDSKIKISALYFVSFGPINIKTKIRAFPTIPNKNICVPIGSMLAVQFFYEKFNFYNIFSKHKSKGLDLNSLLIGLVSYKLTDNFSIKDAGKWLNQKGIWQRFVLFWATRFFWLLLKAIDTLTLVLMNEYWTQIWIYRTGSLRSDKMNQD
jgi:hypothetical protein